MGIVVLNGKELVLGHALAKSYTSIGLYSYRFIGGSIAIWIHGVLFLLYVYSHITYT